jgi:hypothetical protein
VGAALRLGPSWKLDSRPRKLRDCVQKRRHASGWKPRPFAGQRKSCRASEPKPRLHEDSRKKRHIVALRRHDERLKKRRGANEKKRRAGLPKKKLAVVWKKKPASGFEPRFDSDLSLRRGNAPKKRRAFAPRQQLVV